MNRTQTRVLLADDHARVRAGIRILLESVPDIVVVGEAKDGVEALELVERLSPDVLLLDVEMPRMTGNEVAEKLRELESPVQILALSAHDDSQYIIGMLNNGASGYLMKEEVPDKLVKAVRSVAKGEKGWVSSRVAEILALRARTERKNRKTYTERELKILKLFKAGRTKTEIEQELRITASTLATHTAMLLSKFGARSIDELLQKALEEGIL